VSVPTADPDVDKDEYMLRTDDDRTDTYYLFGSFRSYGAAEIEARELAEKAPAHVTFRVQRGSPTRPGKLVGPPIRGVRG
jgi:hypothetical protein